ncbi:MAG: hypothetical protein AAF633_06910 [Chloroflexota bacterium]
MTFQEKNITVSLVNFSLILLFFTLRLFQISQNGNFNSSTIFRLWGVVIIMAIFVTIAATILTHIVSIIIEAIRTGEKDPDTSNIDLADERDQLIDLRGTKVTYTASSFGVFIAMLIFVFGQPALVMFTLLIFVGVIAQIMGDATRLYLYRAGF